MKWNAQKKSFDRNIGITMSYLEENIFTGVPTLGTCPLSSIITKICDKWNLDLWVREAIGRAVVGDG